MGLLLASGLSGGLSGPLIGKTTVLDQTDAAPVVTPGRDENTPDTVIPPELLRGRFGPALRHMLREAHVGAGLQTNTRAASCRHEAGRAVVAAHALGQQVDLVSVKQVGRSQWKGLTHTVGSPWRIAMDTSPESDIRIAWGVLAGRTAERLLDPNDYHPATSMDELVFARFLTMLAAAKSERDPDDLFEEVQNDVAGFLERHARYVERLAAALFYKGEIRGGELARLLRSPAHHHIDYMHLSPADAEIAREVDEDRRREREPRIPRHLLT